MLVNELLSSNDYAVSPKGYIYRSIIVETYTNIALYSD